MSYDPFNTIQMEKDRQEMYKDNPGYAATLFGAGLQIMKGKAPTAIFTHADPVADGTLSSPEAIKAEQLRKEYVDKLSK